MQKITTASGAKLTQAIFPSTLSMLILEFDNGLVLRVLVRSIAIRFSRKRIESIFQRRRSFNTNEGGGNTMNLLLKSLRFRKPLLQLQRANVYDVPPGLLGENTPNAQHVRSKTGTGIGSKVSGLNRSILHRGHGRSRRFDVARNDIPLMSLKNSSTCMA